MATLEAALGASTNNPVTYFPTLTAAYYLSNP